MSDNFSQFISKKSNELNKATEKQKDFIYKHIDCLYDEFTFDIESLSKDEATELINDITIELSCSDDFLDWYDYQ
ncbi:hypothetical protein Koombakaat1_00044 [Staphylococcus phage Koomba-kaat_1]|nr:hypothetical protein RP15_gp151 [Staphylococcus phage vB_Sau-RP15]UXE02834.1 hypothetical protein Koombakaat1_00044 [Staphylococcus phage Koomba-kaat_1]